jgi:hypothetical protein
MAKNITELPLVDSADIADDDQIYLVTGIGTTDSRTTVKALSERNIDRGGIYDADGAVTISDIPQAITCASVASAAAKGFTADENTGIFTFNALAVGKVYEIEFTYLAPKGGSTIQYWAQLNFNGLSTIMDAVYVSNNASDAYVSMGGKTFFAVTANGDTASIELVADANGQSAQTPITVNVIVRIT